MDDSEPEISEIEVEDNEGGEEENEVTSFKEEVRKTMTNGSLINKKSK